MKTHAVKEILLECLLCVEVEPQPEWVNLLDRSLVKSPQKYAGSVTWCGISNNDDRCLQERTPPIAIGDTVYQGEEWIDPYGQASRLATDLVDYPQKYDGMKNRSLYIESPETMPIELADKTFKVIGIEVEQLSEEYLQVCSADPDQPTYTIPIREIPDIPEGPEGELITIKKWFWSYKLEKMKG